MTTTSRTDDNSNFEIPLKLSKPLEDSGIIHKFVIDTDDKYVDYFGKTWPSALNRLKELCEKS